MVEEIEKLEADTKHTVFPTWNLCILHEGKICAEVARATKAVAALRKRYARTATGPVWARQCSAVESRLATRLDKKRAGIW